MRGYSFALEIAFNVGGLFHRKIVTHLRYIWVRAGENERSEEFLGQSDDDVEFFTFEEPHLAAFGLSDTSGN